jgi:hypothetical protein
MRTIRRMAFGLAFVVLVPSVSAAQAGRLFNDSWFWGAKGGVVTINTTAGVDAVRPSAGIEWLITRKRGALYIAADQTFFNSASSLQGTGGTQYLVGIHDLRRYTAALLAFPITLGRFRPYGGIGLSLNEIQSAAPIDSVADPVTARALDAAIRDEKDRAAFVTMAGVQAELHPFSVFGQVVYMPAKSGFLLNGRSTYMLEGGIRFNVGSAHEAP